MRQHSKAPSLFDGVFGVVGSHRPNHCDQGVGGGRLQLPGGQPHQLFASFLMVFIYVFQRSNAKPENTEILMGPSAARPEKAQRSLALSIA